jgi:hypothetical protein
MTARSVSVGLMLLGLAAAESRGLKPRPNADEYPSVKTQNGVTVAARVLTTDEVRSGFVTDLERRYAVM